VYYRESKTCSIDSSPLPTLCALRDLRFDAVAFRGMSGALIGPPVAVRMNKSMIMVRKDNDRSHSSHLVEGDRSVKRYIILDDFQSTGTTGAVIVRAVKEFQPKARCLGLLAVQRLDLQKLDAHKPSILDRVYLGRSGAN
jgi:adenine/guanine phosphoribosyltransferase-like PRPP-binding protein